MIGEPKDLEPRLGDEIPEDWVKQATQEIRAKYRSIQVPLFKDKEDVEMHIWQPTTGEDSLCTTIYTKTYSKLLKDPDMITKTQMKKVLAERGIWGEDQEKQIEVLRDQQKDIEYSAVSLRSKNKNPNPATLARIRSQWNEVKTKIQNLIIERENYFSNTIEGRAEEEQLKAKLSLCVKYPDGTRVWPHPQDLDNESERGVVSQIMNEAIVFWMGLTQEIIHDLPAKLIFGGEKTDQKTSS